jgi:hypothetical protein
MSMKRSAYETTDQGLCIPVSAGEIQEELLKAGPIAEDHSWLRKRGMSLGRDDEGGRDKSGR